VSRTCTPRTPLLIFINQVKIKSINNSGQKPHHKTINQKNQSITSAKKITSNQIHSPNQSITEAKKTTPSNQIIPTNNIKQKNYYPHHQIKSSPNQSDKKTTT
jgi:hypothetical protein